MRIQYTYAVYTGTDRQNNWLPTQKYIYFYVFLSLHNANSMVIWYITRETVILCINTRNKQYFQNIDSQYINVKFPTSIVLINQGNKH